MLYRYACSSIIGVSTTRKVTASFILVSFPVTQWYSGIVKEPQGANAGM